MTERDFQQQVTDLCRYLGLKASTPDLVLSKIEFDESGCWLWAASRKANGYGQFNSGGRNWNAHRLVYLLSGLEIPADHELDHLCRVRHCVNPDHLEPVDHAENTRRQFAAVTHCPARHPYSAENTYLWNGMRHCRTCRAERNRRRRAA